MIVCDFCKERVFENKTYKLPMSVGYDAELSGVVVRTFEKIEDLEVVMCHSCKKKIVEFLKIIKQ